MATTFTAVADGKTFTRTSATQYTHAVVRNSPRAMRAVIEQKPYSGVIARWRKDHGYGVTWHKSYDAAIRAAAAKYVWDHTATVVAIVACEVAA